MEKKITTFDFYTDNRQAIFGIMVTLDDSSWIIDIIYASTCARKKRDIWGT